MKLVLKDKKEIEITSMSDNYNTAIVADEEKRSTTFTIVDPSETITIEYLKDLLTIDNMSAAQIVYNNSTVKNIKPCKITSIAENISDTSHSLLIRTIYA